MQNKIITEPERLLRQKGGNMKAYVKVYHWNKNGTIKHDTYKFNSLEEAREYYNKKYIAKGMMKTLCKGNHEELEKETNY